MSYPLYTVDAFTNRRFGGNPAAVCVLPDAKDSAWMQSVAAEINLSETAFVYRTGDSFHLTWFAPAVEVALCGHATIATSHILWESKLLPEGSPATFHTLSGRLTAVKTGAWINLDFPSLAVEEAPAPEGLLKAVGVNSIFVGRSRFDVLVVVETEDEVLAAEPDFAGIAQIPAVRGVILTSRSRSLEYDFVSRFFCPSVGVNEDPATGSSHCSLAPYWSAILGRNELTGYQASKREGIIRTSIQGTRVQISGQAVTVTCGQLL
jgi:PhzF family phenazine biosynthesis protein